MEPELYHHLNRTEVLTAPTQPLMDMFAKTLNVFALHDSVMASISGGSDSDILMDLLARMDPERKKVVYVFFNTGLEYDATKQHLAQLEKKYGVKIEVIPPVMPIPTCCRKFGVPFWSKRVSEYIYRLQKHNFQWEDEPFEVLYARYPRCKVALKWWCNEWPKKENGKESAFNIRYTPWLKEFMIENPPPPISAKCCEKAKKEPARRYQAAHDFDLSCNGIRKLEKGARADSFKTCFSTSAEGLDLFRPLFWLSDEDKKDYKNHYGVVNSDCYEVWGMTRTGCCGCPYGKEFEQELELMSIYEPKMYRAAVKIFGSSYEYTREYIRFRNERNAAQQRIAETVDELLNED